MTSDEKRPRDFLAWAVNTFGPVAGSRPERAMRFFEEAAELMQAESVGRDVLQKIIDRVYSRPAGDVVREIGQAQACLECLAENIGVSADREAAKEFARVQSIPAEEWARRHAVKTELGITGDRT